MAQLALLASRKEEANRRCVSLGKAVGKWSEEREGLAEEETGSEARRKEQEMKKGDWGWDWIASWVGGQQQVRRCVVFVSGNRTDQAQASGVRRVRRAPLPVQSGQSGQGAPARITSHRPPKH